MPHSLTLRMFSVPAEMLKILVTIVSKETGTFIVDNHYKLLKEMYKVLDKIVVIKYLDGDAKKMHDHCWQKTIHIYRYECHVRTRITAKEKRDKKEANRVRSGFRKKERNLSYSLGAFSSAIFAFADSLNIRSNRYFTRSWLPRYMRVESMITILNKYDYHDLMNHYNLRMLNYTLRTSLSKGLPSYENDFLSKYDIEWRAINIVLHFPIGVEFLIFEYSIPNV